MAQVVDFDERLNRLLRAELDRRGSGSSSGGGDEGRMGRIEKAVEHVEDEIREVKADLRKLLGLNLGCYVAIAGTFLLLAGMLVTGYLRLTDRLDAGTVRLEQAISRQPQNGAAAPSVPGSKP